MFFIILIIQVAMFKNHFKVPQMVLAFSANKFYVYSDALSCLLEQFQFEFVTPTSDSCFECWGWTILKNLAAQTRKRYILLIYIILN